MDYNNKLKEYITTVVSRNASDIHFNVDSVPVVRIFKELTPLSVEKNLSEEDVFGLLSVMLSPEDLERYQQQKYIEFSYHVSSDAINARFRGNAYYRLGSPAITLRTISLVIPTLEELGLPEKLKDITRLQQGLFLVVGPTGSGKSTTAASMLDYINTNDARHIISIEDPVEFLISPKKSIISQRQVPIDARSFEEGLATALRSDGDVIFVSELRRQETMEIGMTAAEVGHLVITTVHANSATQAVNRIIDTFPAIAHSQIREVLASSLIGVFSMRLVPGVSKGLVPAYELFLNNTASANLIRTQRVEDINNIIQTNLHNGMISLDQNLSNLVKAGEISLETAYAYASNRLSIEKFIN